MDTASRLTVFFEEPFWVAVYERTSKDKLEVCRVVFGAEPKDYEVYRYFLDNWHKLRFSPPVEHTDETHKINPKRMRREISSSLLSKGVGTKAQQALKLQYEQQKAEVKKIKRQKNEERKQEQFELRIIKKKQKHKGR